jgi:putative inorganic carbon (hco3(-)) transporter
MRQYRVLSEERPPGASALGAGAAGPAGTSTGAVGAGAAPGESTGAGAKVATRAAGHAAVEARTAERPVAILLIRLGAGIVGVATLFSWWASPDRLSSLPWSVITLAGVALVLLVTGPGLGVLVRHLRTSHLAWFYLGAGFLALVTALFTSRWQVYKLTWLNSVYSALPSIRSFSWGRQGLQPNQTGAILAVFTAFALAVALLPRCSRGKRRAALGLAVAGTVVVFMTGSRAALAGLVVVYLAVLVIRTRHVVWAWAWGVVILGITLFTSGQYSRVLGFFVHDEGLDTKLASRLDIWSSALRGIQDHFFTGIGLGVFNQVIPARYPYHVVGLSFPVSQAHNLFLDVALAIGVPGLIGFVLLLVGSVMLLVKCRAERWEGSAIALGILGSLVVYLVFGITDSISLSVPTSFIVWIWCCSSVMLYQIGIKKSSSHDLV